MPKTPTPITARVVLPIVAIVLGVGLLSAGFLALLRHSDSPRSGGSQTIPDFKLHRLNSSETVTFAQLEGKVFLINFWATWCEPCMTELPSIIKLDQAYRAKGLRVLGINVDDNPTVVVPRVVKRLGIGFSLFSDSDGNLAELFDVHAIPLTVILSKEKKILWTEDGEQDWFSSAMRTRMEQWLGM